MKTKLVKQTNGIYLLNGEMVKGGWVAPPNAVYDGYDGLTDENFRNVKESGINLLFGVIDPETHFGDLLRFFDLCDAYGLYTIVPEESIGREDFDLAGFCERLEEYRRRDCVVGINIWDEPGYDRIGIFRENVRKIRPLLGDLVLFTNHMPLYAKDEQIYGGDVPVTGEEITAERYAAFLREFNEGVAVDVLSYDFYPFMHEKGICHPRYFEQLALARGISEETGRPLWNFTQVTSWNKDAVRNATYSEIEWMNNTALACGVSGVCYFCYWTPRSGDELFEHGMVDERGLKKKSYHFVRRANETMSSASAELLRADFVGTIAFGDTLAGFPREKNLHLFGDLKQVAADGVLIGCFRREGKNLYYVVNTSVTETRVVELLFSKEIRLEISRGAEKKTFGGDYLTLVIPEGEAVLVKDA